MLCMFACRFSEELLKLLWPRFYLILDMNVASIRDTDPSRLGNIDTRPHYVSSPLSVWGQGIITILLH